MSDSNFDLVIVGSGAGGLTAAITAKLAGLNPLLIEKTPFVGGSSALSGGILWLPNNPLLARNGVADSRAASLTYMANFVEPGDPASTPERRAAFVDAIAPMVALLEKQGMKFEPCLGYSDYYEHLPGGLAAGRSLRAALFNANRLGDWKARLRAPTVPLPVHASESALVMQVGVTWRGKLMVARVAGRYLAARLTGRSMYGAGGALQGRMLEIALRLGVEIWTDAALVDLDIQAGRVIGAQVRHQGAARTIRAAHGVLMAAGGFARNLGMREQYQRKPVSVDWTKANPGETGDSIEAMKRAGAALGWMSESWWVMTWVAGNDTYQIVPELAKPHGMLVDISGQRFVNEARSYTEVGLACYQRNSTVRAIPAWFIADSRARKRYMFGFQFPGRVPQKWLDAGWVKQDATIAGLARQCGIDPAGLESTVARFNGFAEAGVDGDFQRGDNAYARFFADPTHKPNGNLGTLSEPPFWAAPLVPGDVGTCGGAITDPDARVLRDDGTIIEGLYAAGNCAAPFAGPHYVGAGQSIAASAVFGYRAARHAAGNPETRT